MSSGLRDVKEHVFITLTTSRVLDIAGATTFDLDTAASFLLNMLHVCSTMTYNLSTEVESG